MKNIYVLKRFYSETPKKDQTVPAAKRLAMPPSKSSSHTAAKKPEPSPQPLPPPPPLPQSHPEEEKARAPAASLIDLSDLQDLRGAGGILDFAPSAGKSAVQTSGSIVHAAADVSHKREEPMRELVVQHMMAVFIFHVERGCVVLQRALDNRGAVLIDGGVGDEGSGPDRRKVSVTARRSRKAVLAACKGGASSGA